MRKLITTTLIAFVLLVVLFESGIIDALLVFLLSGSIPGTPIALTPSMMMAILTASAWLLLVRVTALSSTHFKAIRRHLKRTVKKQDHMPKRRYGRI